MAADIDPERLKPWIKLGHAVITRRVELGWRTRRAFAQATGLTVKTLGEIERGERPSYDPATLAQVEQTLRWPPGFIRDMVDRETAAVPAAAGDDPDASWLSTREGLARHLHRDDLPLVELLHRSGLNDAAKFDLILRIRAARERQNADLLGDVGQAIRQAGGWAPEQPYPPTWLADEVLGGKWSPVRNQDTPDGPILDGN